MYNTYTFLMVTMVTLRRQATTHTILLSVALMSAILCPSMSFFSGKVARRVLFLHPRSMADRQWQCIDVDGTSSFSFSSSTAMFATASPPLVPRAAVAVVVRWCNASSSSSPIDITCAPTPRYLLVQRGNEPNKGMWSIPGGKIESGEGTLDAAKRELHEETGLTTTMQQQITTGNEWTLKWHDDGPFTCSDSIHQPTAEGMKGFHYVISQYFAEVITTPSSPPHIEARDDAMDAKWWSAEDIQHGEDQGSVSDGVLKVIERSELLYEKGLLHCD